MSRRRGHGVEGSAGPTSCHVKGRWGWAPGAGSKQDVSLTKRGLSRWTGTEGDGAVGRGTQSSPIDMRLLYVCTHTHTYIYIYIPRYVVSRRPTQKRRAYYVMSQHLLSAIKSARRHPGRVVQSVRCLPARGRVLGGSAQRRRRCRRSRVDHLALLLLLPCPSSASLIYPKPRAAQFARQRRNQR